MERNCPVLEKSGPDDVVGQWSRGKKPTRMMDF